MSARELADGLDEVIRILVREAVLSPVDVQLPRTVIVYAIAAARTDEPRAIGLLRAVRDDLDARAGGSPEAVARLSVLRAIVT